MTSARRGAIIGFGSVAENGHLPGWRDVGDFEIVAVADPVAGRRARAEELIPNLHTYSSLDELFASEALDFVDIASPPLFHQPAILAAAAAGVDVLCEKPLTVTAEIYRPMRRAVEESEILLHVVHNWKYSEAFLALSDLLASGSLGRIDEVVFETRRNGWSVSADDWRIKRSIAGGGILVDHGWHNFYLILAVAGEQPTGLRATLERLRYREAEIEDTACCRIDFPRMTAEIRLTWAASERRTRWEVRGRSGRVVVDDDVVEIEHDGPREVRRLHSGLSAGSHHADWFPGVIDSFRRELDDPGVRGTNRREAEQCLVLLDRAYASAAAGGARLELPSPDELFG
jgi:predicted dehydrogenase